MADLNVTKATSAYLDSVARSKKLAQPESATQSEDAASTVSFGDFLDQYSRRAVDINKEGEKQSIATIFKDTDLPDLVTAVSNAEVTLQTVVAVRDKVIQAYQDIIKMPI